MTLGAFFSRRSGKAVVLVRLALLALAVTGCGPREPYWHHYCASSHVETRVAYWPASSGPGLGLTPYGAGIHVGGGMHLVNETVCDRYDSTWVVPDTTR